MSDKTEYSRLLLKRTGISGEVPTIPPITATTLNEFNATDLFVGEMYVNTADDLLWVRTDSGILPISLSGSTGTTIPDLLTVLNQGNTTGAFPIVVSSGSTIQYLGLNSGTTTTILGLDASGNTITTTGGGGGSQDLSQVLSIGNITNGNNIIVSTGDTITSPSGENEISLQSADSLLLQSTYSLGGTNFRDQIKLRAPSPTDASVEIGSYDLTNNPYTKTEYRPISISDYSYDSGGAFVFTRLESTGFTIDLSNTSAGYFEIKGLLSGTATDLLGLDSNNRVVPYSIPMDIYSTGGTFSAGTITIDRNDGNSFSITGITAGVSSVSTGTGLSGNTTTGDITLINTAPDQIVSISGGTGIITGGTYPNFTITNSAPDQVVSISGLTGIEVSGSYPNFALTNTIRKGSFGITIDGGGSAITTGVKGYITIPYDCTITGWDIFSDVSGSIVVDVWKDTYANFPPTVADTIAGSEKPTLSSAVKNQDNLLSTWTTSVSANDIIAFNVDSASTLTRVNLTIKVLKTS